MTGPLPSGLITNGHAQKNARESGQSLALIHETGLTLQLLVRRMWAPQGQTPVMYCWDRPDRLSVTAAPTLALRIRGVGLYFAIYEHNITVVEVEAFLREVQRHLRRPLMVIKDRWSAHRKLAKVLNGDARLHIEWFRAYAPDLNPVEYRWNHTKYADLANFTPDDLLGLQVELDWSMYQTKKRAEFLRCFFHAVELET